MALTPIPIASFAAGVDTKSRQQDLPEGALREATNVDIIRGKPARAPGYTEIPGLPAGHSLWTWPGFRFALMVSAVGDLVRIDGDSTATILASPGQDDMSYCELGGKIYCSNGSFIGRVNADGSFHPWGMDAPPSPIAAPNTTAGGLCEGTYQLAYAGVAADGEEGPPSRVAAVTIAEGQGITIFNVPQAPGISTVNLYITDPDSTELYFYGPIMPGASVVEMGGAMRTKRVLVDLEAERFPAGRILASFHRQILAAQANVLRYTRNRQASLWRPSEDWYQFESLITVVAPVLDGVYVGTEDAVYFLAGASPEDWSRVMVDNRGALDQPLTNYIPSDLFGGEPASGNIALWWNTEGALWMGRNGGVAAKVSGNFALPEVGTSANIVHWEADGTERVISSFDMSRGRAKNPTTSKDTPVVK